MKKYKITQKSICEGLDFDEKTFRRMKKGEAEITKSKLNAVKKELERQKQLWFEKQKAVDCQMLINIENGKDKHSMETIESDEKTKETLTPIMREIERRQKIKRNKKEFVPSEFASVDMITLSRVITNYEEQVMFENLRSFAGADPRCSARTNNGYRNSIGQFKHIFDFEGDDVKVHVDYVYWNFDTKEEVRLLKVRFNPNKWDCDNPFLKILILILGQDPYVFRFDVCKDYLDFTYNNVYYYADQEVKCWSDKEGVRTIYFGQKEAKNINLMIYDKRQEILKKDQKDIGFDCIRAETRIFLKYCDRFRLVSEAGDFKVPQRVYAGNLVKFKKSCDYEDLIFFEKYAENDKRMDFSRHIDRLKKISNEQIEKKDVAVVTPLDVTLAIRDFSYRYKVAYTEYQFNRMALLKFPKSKEQKQSKTERQKEKRTNIDMYNFHEEYLKEPVPYELIESMNDDEKKIFRDVENRTLEEYRKEFEKIKNQFEPTESDVDWDNV